MVINYVSSASGRCQGQGGAFHAHNLQCCHFIVLGEDGWDLGSETKDSILQPQETEYQCPPPNVFPEPHFHISMWHCGKKGLGTTCTLFAMFLRKPELMELKSEQAVASMAVARATSSSLQGSMMEKCLFQ